MATISDVARLAGVSTTTISRYLNGGRVRAELAIADAIEELRFRPSPAARSLKLGVTHSIGVVVPDIANPFFAAVVKGAETVARSREYSVFLYNTEESADREEEVLAALADRVDGIILAPATEPADVSPVLRRAQPRVVFLDRELAKTDAFDSVLVDNAGGARQAARHLLELGHERIGLISGPLDTTPGRGRHEGFVDEMARAGVELKPDTIQIGDFRQEGGYQCALRLLALKQPPTAIFAANNLMSIGALRALHAMRIRVPSDVSFMGFDDLDLAEILDPPLTVIDRPMEEQGALAMRLLLARIDEPNGTAPQRIVLETRLLVRMSTAPPRAVGRAPHTPKPQNQRKENHP